jgi:hypothetical protein
MNTDSLVERLRQWHSVPTATMDELVGQLYSWEQEYSDQGYDTRNLPDDQMYMNTFFADEMMYLWETFADYVETEEYASLDSFTF